MIQARKPNWNLTTTYNFRKHQRTQGHIQATELYEKRKADGLIQEPDQNIKNEDLDNSETRSEDSLPTADSSTPSNPDSEDSKLDDFRPSPKRKQSHPQYSPQMMNIKVEREESALTPREAQISINIEFNTQTHGYDCRQCDFSSHDHSVMKEHVVMDHLRDKADLQCKECMVTFTKPFNLKIHIRKHETSSQFLPCEYCEQVFKVPNKLIKHMEGVHSVCPTCGEKNSDKTALQDHMEKIHNEPKKGVHANLQHLSNLTTLLPGKPRLDVDNRHAKMRKLDTLAEHIRAKQLQNAKGTNVINGNEKLASPIDSQLVVRRRKSDMPAVCTLIEKRPENFPMFRPGLESLVNQLNKMNSEPVIKSENNNILSSLSKMTEFPHRFPRYPSDHDPHQNSEPHHLSRHHADLTPPVSPPHSRESSFTRITPQNSFVGLNNNAATDDSEDSNETGLDLTVKKEPKSDENEVSTTADSQQDEVYRSRHLINPSFPYIVPSLPFLTRMPLTPIPHHNTSFTEHLFKLAAISRPQSIPSGPQDLSKPTTSLAGHPSVLSAMLGHRPQVPTVFPVFPGGIPASMFPQHPLPPSSEDRSSSPPPLST